MCIHNPVWNGILQRTHTGDCTSEEIAEIKKLVLMNSECNVPDFSLPPWNKTILVTPHNSVCSLWNDIMLTQHAQKMGQIRYIVYVLISDLSALSGSYGLRDYGP
jgi:hypothetical protein